MSAVEIATLVTSLLVSFKWLILWLLVVSQQVTWFPLYTALAVSHATVRTSSTLTAQWCRCKHSMPDWHICTLIWSKFSPIWSLHLSGECPIHSIPKSVHVQKHIWETFPVWLQQCPEINLTQSVLYAAGQFSTLLTLTSSGRPVYR